MGSFGRVKLNRLAAGVLLGVLAAATLAACGLGAGPAPGGVALTVTRDFGSVTLRSWGAPQVRGEETVMSLLMRNASVETRYSGGFVQSIDGVSGGRERGQPVDWFYYVNGSEAPLGAAETVLHRGDHIWWDRHDWSQTDHIPAVVGSFPEPFVNGLGGKRLPVRIECALVTGAACRAVRSALRELGVPVAVATLGGGAGPHTLRLVVAPFAALAADPAAQAIARGPAASGVYARFAAGGSTLTLLDPDGRPASTFGAGAGLIAATAIGEAAPVWLVTGTDAAGVQRAAGSFRAAELEDRFALAVGSSGQALAVPQAKP
jgi:hypothetical protein